MLNKHLEYVNKHRAAHDLPPLAGNLASEYNVARAMDLIAWYAPYGLNPFAERCLGSYCDEELQQRYANAHTTACKSLGQKKADRNELRAARYMAELTKRGLSPNGRKGKFNGLGAN